MQVVIAEDSVLLREGLARLLTDEGIDVVACVGDGDALLAAVATHLPDVAVTDIRMPPTQSDEGIRAALEIRARHPGVGVLVLSQYVESRHAVELLGGGGPGVGYLLKDHVTDVDMFVGSLRRVAAGGSAIDPAVVTQLMSKPRVTDPLDRLSGREREILGLMAEGRSNSAICQALFISPKTLETHITRMFTKLDLAQTPDDHRRVLAVLQFLQRE